MSYYNSSLYTRACIAYAIRERAYRKAARKQS
jgi:hypothetical protein